MGYNANGFISDILKSFDARVTLAELGERLSENDFDGLVNAASLSGNKMQFKADAYSAGLFIPKPFVMPTHLDYRKSCPTDLVLPAPAAPVMTPSDMAWTSSSPVGGFGTGLKNRRYRDQYLIVKQTDGTILEQTMSDVELDHCGLLLRFDGSSATKFTAERIRAVDAGWGSDGYGLFKMQHTMNDLTFRDCFWQGSPYRVYDDAEAIINIRGKIGESASNTGSGFLIERVFGFYAYALNSGYPNMDGISVESCYNDGVIQDCYFAHIGDACYDIKGQNWRLHNTVGEDARETYKIWGASDRHGRLVSINPGAAHFIIKVTEPAGNDFEVIEAYGDAGKPIFLFEDSASQVRVSGAIVAPQPGQVLARCNEGGVGSSVVLPNGTKITLTNTNPVLVS